MEPIFAQEVPCIREISAKIFTHPFIQGIPVKFILLGKSYSKLSSPTLELSRLERIFPQGVPFIREIPAKMDVGIF